jgi:hypothetical protein
MHFVGLSSLFENQIQMNKSVALSLLGLNDSVEIEDIMERLDAESFAVRDHFMRQPVVPVLFRSRVNRLVELSDVARVLNIQPLGAPVELPSLLPMGSNFVLLVRNHVENIRRLRTAMASTLDPDVLVRFGNTLCNLQLRYMEQFLVLSLDVSGEGIHTNAVPARDEADWQKLLESIESNESWAKELIARERARMAQILEREVQ